MTRSPLSICLRRTALVIVAVLIGYTLQSAETAQPDNLGGGTGNTYYLDTNNGSDSNNGQTTGGAWKTLEHAISMLNDGDTLLIRAGDYYPTSPTSSYDWSIAPQGSQGEYITIRNYPGERPVFHVASLNGIQLWNAQYFEIDGIEVIGKPDPASIVGDPENSADRQALIGNHEYVGNGISIIGDNARNIRIRNCVVHRVGGNGISLGSGNIFLVEGNTVYNASHRSDAGNSGISAAGVKDSLTDAQNYGIVIRNNTIYDCINMLDFFEASQITDGNGVIIDWNPDFTNDRILVANNLAFNNGGRGVHAYHSSNVDFVNNTCYYNLRSEELRWEGELSSVGPSGSSNDNNRFYNNIAVARPDRRAYNISNTTNWVFQNNLAWSQQAPALGVDSTNLLDVDPRFVNPGTDPATVDFNIQTTSPALDAGQIFNDVETDFAGNARIFGSLPDMGAYELGTPGSLTPPGGVNPTYSGGTVTITWSDSSNDEEGFTIERKRAGEVNWVEIGQVGAGVQTFTDSAVTHSTEYEYHVYAWKDGGATKGGASFPGVVMTPGQFHAPSTLYETLSADTQSTRTIVLYNHSSQEQTFTLTTPPVTGSYTLTDSKTGSASYVWNDISSVGTHVPDIEVSYAAYSPALSIGFEFPYFNNTYTTLCVINAGYLVPGTTLVARDDNDFANIPASAYGSMIAFCFDDLNWGGSSAIYYHKPDSDTFIVQFDNVPLAANSSQLLTCQIVLKSSGLIQMYYKNATLSAGTYAVGAQRRITTTDVPYVVATNNGGYLEDNMAVEISPPVSWAHLPQNTVTIPGYGSAEVTVEFNSAGLSAGTQTMNIDVTSDLAHQPAYTIPVELEVTSGSVNSYASWIAGYPSLSGTDTEPLSDPNGDGFSNLIHYSVNADPTQVLPEGKLPYASATEISGKQYLQLNYIQHSGGNGSTGIDYSADGLTYYVETAETPDSEVWVRGADILHGTPSVTSNGDGTETVTVTFLPALDDLDTSKLFARLVIAK